MAISGAGVDRGVGTSGRDRVAVTTGAGTIATGAVFAVDVGVSTGAASLCADFGSGLGRILTIGAGSCGVGRVFAIGIGLVSGVGTTSVGIGAGVMTGAGADGAGVGNVGAGIAAYVGSTKLCIRLGLSSP